MKKILILEDDRILARTLQTGLESPRAQAVCVHTLEDFYEYIESERVDLCVMDRMVENQDSVEAIGYIHDVLPQAKILFLTKKNTVMDRVNGLEAGADDYLSKPFSLAELRLRARGLLSISRAHQSPTGVDLGGIVFFPQLGVLETPEEKIFLRKRETEILTCLAQAAGTHVTKRTLNSLLWPASYEPNPSTIDVYIRRLRQKLGKYHSILQTRRGFGYRLTMFQRELERNRRPSMGP